ncbi:MAG: beta-ketoacyl-ACP synthase II [Candidatus Promineifilaceae bacterium]
MRKRVVITGMGAYTPLGNSPAAAWGEAAAGRSGIGPITQFDPAGLKTRIGGEVRDFDAEALFGRRDARRMDRATQLALAAANQALEDARLALDDEETRNAAGVVLGSGVGNVASAFNGITAFNERGPARVSPFFIPMMLMDTPSATISIAHGLRGPNLAIATACASANNALGEAAKMIQRGAAEVMLAGGVEAAMLPVIIAGFNSAGALSSAYNDDPEAASRPFDAGRDGFVASEGAAVLVLEDLERAVARGARIYAEFLGYGTSADAYHISAPDENGAGAVLSMQGALDDAGLEPADIDYVNAHGTGTKLNDKIETLALKRIFGERAYDIPVSSTKSMHGHLLGAAGALEAILGIHALAAGLLPPTINYTTPDPECDLDYVPNVARPAAIQTFLSNSFGLGGHNATIIIGRYNGAGDAENA